jgi:integrase
MVAALDLIPEADLTRLTDSVNGYVRASKAPATLRAYRIDWRLFCEWCAARGVASLPAEPSTVAGYLAALADRCATATIARKLTSINVAHAAAGFERPSRSAIVEATWKGIRRTLGVSQQGKDPLLTADVRAMVATLGTALIDMRDRALILDWFAGAARRSELVAFDVEHLTFTGLGLVATIGRSKTDQEGEGAQVGIPYGSDPATCPVLALRAWLDVSGIVEGPIFRRIDRHGRLRPDRISARAAAERVKLHATSIGKDPARIGGHSLRSGLITSAVTAGASERDVMAHSRHKSIPVFRRYVRGVGLFDRNPASKAGL